MFTFACVVGRSLALVAKIGRVRSGLEQDLDEVRAPIGCSLVERRVASCLRHVDIRSLLDQQARGLAIPAYGNASVERLVVLGIPRKAVYMCPMG